MDNLFVAAVMGIVEGLTEFLPISSSGHMALAGEFMHFSGSKASTFEVVIQLGAIMAVVTIYWQRFLGLLKPGPNKGLAGIHGIWLLFLTTLPVCVCGLLFHSLIKKYLFSPMTIVYALVAGAICMILVDSKKYKPVCNSLDEITPKMALLIGLCQCVALWPGFSRSASTIMGGLVMGAKRQVAVQYSFIAAVPVMFAATGYDLLKNYSLFTSSDFSFFAVGLLCAYISALLAIRFFISLLGKITLVPFALYRFAIAPVIWFFVVK